MDQSVEQEDGLLNFNPGRRIGKRWKIIEKLDEGGFGQVFKVEDLTKPGRLCALKVESTDMEGGSAIKLEMNVIEHINSKKDPSPHIPTVFHARKHKKFCYMVMELLGRNLKHLKSTFNNDLMPISEWSRIGLQCLHSIKLMHDRGYVHRDIKPSNFVLGYHKDYTKARIVHVLDFGLARAFAFRKGQRWEPRKARTHIDFRGTFRYASPNMHRAEDLGRRDDIYSLLYMLIELHVGLPWQTDKEKEAIEVKKLHMEEKPEDLCLNFPEELHGIFPHLKGLNFYSRPNYTLVFDGLIALMKKCGVTLNDKYEWETAEDFKNFSSTPRKCMCEDIGTMMAADPIKINAAPLQFTANEDGPTREDVPIVKGKGVADSGKVAKEASCMSMVPDVLKSSNNNKSKRSSKKKLR